MSMTRTIPVRLDADTRLRLDAVAEEIGTTRAGIIRFCTETWLRHFEKTGVASLPPDWKAIMASMDGRTSASRSDSYTGRTGKKANEVSSKRGGAAEALAAHGADEARRALPKSPPSSATDAPTVQTLPLKTGSGRRSSPPPVVGGATPTGPKAGKP